MTMMSSKVGTKAFVEPRAQATQSADVEKTMTAQQLEQLGGKDVGEVLNKVADPNYIDPAKRVRHVGSDKLDKDAFMKLMLAQMKNQDPTNPLKSHEMAAQLAQFSSLEQLQNVNTNLDQMRAAQKPAETYQSLNFIGKAVAGDSAKISRVKGDTIHDFNYAIPVDAKKVSITVKDANGELVRKVDFANLKAGANIWRWNGETERGEAAKAGDYKIVVDAESTLGQKLDVKSDFQGIISGVNYTPDGPVLMIGNQSIKLQDVKRIFDRSEIQQDQKNDQNSKIKTSAALKNNMQVSQDKETVQGAADADEAPVGNVMTGLAMSPDLLDRLQKETK